MTEKLVLHEVLTWLPESRHPVHVLTVASRGGKEAGEWLAPNGLRLSWMGGRRSQFSAAPGPTLCIGAPGSACVVHKEHLALIREAIAAYNARDVPATPTPEAPISVIA